MTPYSDPSRFDFYRRKRIRMALYRMGFAERNIRIWGLDNPLMKPHARRVMMNACREFGAKYRGENDKEGAKDMSTQECSSQDEEARS